MPEKTSESLICAISELKEACPWIVFKFNNSNMTNNMHVEDPSNNGVNALIIIDSIIVSCHPWSLTCV